MRIAIAQIATRAGDFDGTARRMAEVSRRAADAGADLLVFPVAALCGVTPAQQERSVSTGTSGRYAFRSSALEITQISVQSPTSVILSIGSLSFSLRKYSPSSTLPNVGLSMILLPFFSPTAFSTSG